MVALIISTDNDLYEYEISSSKLTKKCENISSVFAANDSYFAINTNHELLVWGDNENGSLGVSSKYVDSPQKVDYIKNVVDISSNDFYTMVLLSDSTVWECGIIGYTENESKIIDHHFSMKKDISNAKFILSSNYGNLIIDSDKVYYYNQYNERSKYGIEIENFFNENNISEYANGLSYISCLDEKKQAYILGISPNQKSNTKEIISYSTPQLIDTNYKIDSIYAGFNVIYFLSDDRIIIGS